MVLLFRDFQSELFETLKASYSKLEKQDLAVDHTGHADFALRCFRIAEKGDYVTVCKSVSEICKNMDFIETIDCSGPYVNFRIKPALMFNAVHESLEKTGTYPDTFQDPERVVVEHTSTNPTGPLHVGRSRNSILGDSVARLFTRVGYRVTTQYYVNDSGRQVMAMVLGNRLYFEGKRDANSLLEGYQKIYTEMETDPSLKEKVDQILRNYESGDEATINEVREICSITLQIIIESLKKLDIKIDDYVFESGFIRHGDIELILEDLSGVLLTDDSGKNGGDAGDLETMDGEEIQKGAKYVELPDKRKIFLQRNDGTSLYPLRDIAYHMFKALNADWIIDILGEDHKDHGKSLKYILKDLLDYKPLLDFVFYSFVSLESGRMSTRRGRIVSLDGLIEKAVEEAAKVVREKRKDLSDERIDEIANAVGTSSVRFNMIRVNPDKAMVFRWSEALNFEGDSAPYVMYSYARTSGILDKIEESSDPAIETFNEEERELMKQIYLYPKYLSSAWQSIRPDILSSYVLDLVKAFSDFYSRHSVIKAEPADLGKRIELVKMYRKTLEDVCHILGIRLLDEM